MKTLRTLILVLMFSVPAFAGVIEAPPCTENCPPPPCENCLQSENPEESESIFESILEFLGIA